MREPLPLTVAEADRYMIDAATLLLELTARPSDAALLAPLLAVERHVDGPRRPITVVGPPVNDGLERQA